MSEPRVVVTDHAVVRLCERALGIDVSAYRWPTPVGKEPTDTDILRRMFNAGLPIERYREMLAVEVRPLMAADAKGGWLQCGLWALIDGRTLVSVWPSKPDAAKRHRRDRGEARRSA